MSPLFGIFAISLFTFAVGGENEVNKPLVSPRHAEENKESIPQASPLVQRKSNDGAGKTRHLPFDEFMDAIYRLITFTETGVGVVEWVFRLYVWMWDIALYTSYLLLLIWITKLAKFLAHRLNWLLNYFKA
ncbi:unnamed protein product [Calicophoron daubneyi]|uniref:Uncharacterized protein n=1 Tax=Calicophoron daubneyi TaxID=300641 RepID=A0AAV2T4W0_CALDB